MAKKPKPKPTTKPKPTRYRRSQSDVTVQMITPGVPNFVLLDIPGIENGADAPKLAIQHLSDTQKNALAKQWRAALDDVGETQSATDAV